MLDSEWSVNVQHPRLVWKEDGRNALRVSPYSSLPRIPPRYELAQQGGIIPCIIQAAPNSSNKDELAQTRHPLQTFAT